MIGINKNMTVFKRNQRGVILVITMFLLLIISILTIAFLYLQFLEIDLIAHETDYLQAFYLASAGLEHGRKLFAENPQDILDKLNDSPTYSDPNSITPIVLSANKQGSFYHMYSSYESNGTKYVTIKGIGIVNNDKRTVRRSVKFSSTEGEPADPEIWFDPGFGKVRNELDHAPGTSLIVPPPTGEIVWSPSKLLSDVPTSGLIDTEGLTQEQHDAIDDYDSKTQAVKARYLNKRDYPDPYNDNRELLKANNAIYTNYKMTTIEKLDTNELPESSPGPYYWPHSEFDYVEIRKQEKYTSTYTGPSILQTEMVVHDDFTIEGDSKGKTYFLQKLKVEEGATLSTSGNVKIFTCQLELERDARLIGGSAKNPKPESLIIVAEYWAGISYNKDIHGVRLGPSARLYGHIFAPNMRVLLSRGKLPGPENETRVYGSILAQEIVTYVDPRYVANPGYISIIGMDLAEEDMADEPGSWREVSTP